jgi:hypothetical protein
MLARQGSSKKMLLYFLVAGRLLNSASGVTGILEFAKAPLAFYSAWIDPCGNSVQMAGFGGRCDWAPKI